jgi:medium-chain acyl-[acyl-carrier-protein] hydrolase
MPPLHLLCFPYAGGGAAAYRTWRNRLPSSVQVVAAPLPGREARVREAARTRLADLVAQLADELAPHMQGHFAFFGHSMGALVAYELSHYLWARRRPLPLRLFVSAHRSPELPRPVRDLHPLPDAELIDELRRLGGTPEPVLQHAELMAMVLPILRADLEACETYVHPAHARAPLPLPISAFAGADDRRVGPEGLVGWQRHTQTDFRLRVLPGGHFFLHTAQVVLLDAIATDLARTEGERRDPAPVSYAVA